MKETHSRKETTQDDAPMRKLALSLHPLERKVLPFVKDGLSAEDIAAESGMQAIEVLRALQWMAGKGIVELKESSEDFIAIGKNGTDFEKERQLPEVAFLEALLKHGKNAPIAVQKIKEEAHLKDEEINIVLGVLKRNKAIDLTKQESGMVVSAADGAMTALHDILTPVDAFLKKRTFPLPKKEIQGKEAPIVEDLKRRYILIEEKKKTLSASLTDIGKELQKMKIDHGHIVEKVTPGMLKSGEWKGKTFRHYDITASVPKTYHGRKHFVSDSITYIKRIWLEMGFEEMEGNLCQTAFWDLDSLFVPQDHPAREMQDTFYIADMKDKKKVLKGTLPPLASEIKKVHENGAKTGSTGWGGEWKEDAAKEVLLRTHTTVLSAQTIARLKESELPKKFFAVNKVFRNEALDWKHLFEFYQVEGIVVDPHANLSHLLGYLKEFYTKMGYSDVRVRPAHFPYTEPSLEVEVFHPVKKEWVELGGAGIFRPEVVIPLLGKDVPVLAWGQGMERIIVEYFGFSDLRDLYKNDVKQIREIKKWMRI